jgi:carboxyl-terminal processing protease
MHHKNKFSRNVFKLSLFLALGIVLASYTFCNRENKEQLLVKLISQALSIYHYSPPNIDDKFSSNVFDLYLKDLDNGKRFLTKQDLKELESYKTKIDDEINSGSVEFYTRTLEIYFANLDRIQRYCNEILSKPFDFSAAENIETDPDKAEFPADTIALKDIWRKSLKYMTLAKVNDAVKIQEANKNLPDSAKRTFAQMEEDARKSVSKLQNNYLRRIKQAKDIDNFSVFLNAITKVYDPHTEYFSPKEKESFDMSMSGQLEGIGAQLQEADDYIKVVMIVPGSPSWLQGELQVNDIILKVAQENEKPVDLFDMRIDDAVKLIRGKKGTKVTLTVKKIDKTIKEITIKRDVVILEESYAKSAIVTGKTGKKTGYIYLPSFYANFERTETGRSSGDDIEAEIKKLKAEKVSGIILDLRNNGGGSLQDAVKIGGLFITQGPIVQVKTNFGPAKVYTDTDPNIQYDGPLVILVNELSASASEILAAAMQDYKRAIIVGSHTFGKGTVQSMIELDDAVPASYKEYQPLGDLKITIQKYYRVTGDATQLKGVLPDVIMPDIYGKIEIGEREEDYCMPWTKIQSSSFLPWDKMANFDKIVASEREAAAANPDLKTIEEEATEIKKQKDESLVSLNYETYKKEEDGHKGNSKAYDELIKKENGLSFKTMAADDSKFKSDTASVARTNNWINGLKKDLYLKEAYEIVNEIELKK